MSGIDNEGVALGAPQIDRCRQAGNAATYDNDLADFRIIEIGVLNHEASKMNRRRGVEEMPAM